MLGTKEARGRVSVAFKVYGCKLIAVILAVLRAHTQLVVR